MNLIATFQIFCLTLLSLVLWQLFDRARFLKTQLTMRRHESHHMKVMICCILLFITTAASIRAHAGLGRLIFTIASASIFYIFSRSINNSFENFWSKVRNRTVALCLTSAVALALHISLVPSCAIGLLWAIGCLASFKKVEFLLLSQNLEDLEGLRSKTLTQNAHLQHQSFGQSSDQSRDNMKKAG